MRKRIFGRRLRRDTNERKALFRSLMDGLVLHGKIKTTEAKAKAIKGEIEKLVTAAKNKGEESKGLIMSHLANEIVADKIIKEIAPLFKTRPGGYTRILRLAPRVKDAAQMVLLTWVEEVSVTSNVEPKRNAGKKTVKVEKKDKAEKAASAKSSGEPKEKSSKK